MTAASTPPSSIRAMASSGVKAVTCRCDWLLGKPDPQRCIWASTICIAFSPLFSPIGCRATSGVRRLLLWVDALVDPGRPLVMAQLRLHSSRPRVAAAGANPGLALRDPGMLELVQRQVFGLALDSDEPARAEASRHRQIAWDIDRIVPGVEFLLDRYGNIDPPHLQKRCHCHGLLDRMGVYRKDLPIGVPQKVPPNPARPDLRPLGRG